MADNNVSDIDTSTLTVITTWAEYEAVMRQIEKDFFVADETPEGKELYRLIVMAEAYEKAMGWGK
jgi:hypothetical protein